MDIQYGLFAEDQISGDSGSGLSRRKRIKRDKALQGVTKRDIKWDWNERKWMGVLMQDIKEWEKLYPDVDIAQVLQFDIPRWLDKKANWKKAHKSNWKQTICNWLRKEQIKNAF